MQRSLIVKNLPNAISAARLLTVPVLAAAVVMEWLGTFRWLLLACLLSDILDGLIARALDVRSKLGARLDSTADLLVQGTAIVAVWHFHRDEFVAHGGVIATAIGLYVAELLLSLWRYGRPSSFHTVLTRIAGYGQGFFLLGLFFWRWSEPLFYVVMPLLIAASAEEIVLVAMLHEWTADVGGVVFVLRRRRRESS